MKLQWIEDGSDLTIVDHRGHLVAMYREVTPAQDRKFLERYDPGNEETGGAFILFFTFEGDQVGDWTPVRDKDEAMSIVLEFYEDVWQPEIDKLSPWRDEQGEWHRYFSAIGAPR